MPLTAGFLLLFKSNLSCKDGQILTKLKQAIEHGTPMLTSLHLFAVLRHVVRSDGPQELDVVITVVLGHLFSIDLHFPVQSIVEKEVVCHADPVGLHRMALAIVVVPHITLGDKKKQNRLSFTLANMGKNEP
uniref:Uncharacterized protein n=1 Tax=Myripristis murdjan TaxID=586833 RepID=A0A667Y8X4_9TELE